MGLIYHQLFPLLRCFCSKTLTIVNSYKVPDTSSGEPATEYLRISRTRMQRIALNTYDGKRQSQEIMHDPW
jgi:hypothetical protein